MYLVNYKYLGLPSITMSNEMKMTFVTKDGSYMRCEFMDSGIVGIDPYDDDCDSVGVYLDYFMDIVKNEQWRLVK